MLLPPFWKLSSQAAFEVCGFGGESLGILGQELLPFLLLSSTFGTALLVQVVYLLGNDKCLLGIKAKLLLDLLDVIGFERSTVNSTGSLQLRAVANDGSELNHGWLVLHGLALLNSRLDACQVMVTVLDGY